MKFSAKFNEASRSVQLAQISNTIAVSMPYFDSSGWFLIEKTTILTNSCCLYLRGSAFGVALRTEGWLFVLPVWKRDLHVRTRICTPASDMCKTRPSWIPSHTSNFDAIRPAVCEIWKKGVHVLWCRCTLIRHVQSSYLMGPYSRTKFERNRPSRFKVRKRGVRVRTCRCTPPQTCVKLLSNG